MKKLSEVIFLILAISLIGVLVFMTILIPTGDIEVFKKFLLHISILSVLYILAYSAGMVLYQIGKRYWTRRNQADMENLSGVLQAHFMCYALPAICYAVTAGFIYVLSQENNAEEYWQMLQKGDYSFQNLAPWIFGFIGIYSQYYYMRRKIFYSQRTLKIVPLFGKSQVISWREIQEVRYRKTWNNVPILKLVTAKRTFYLKGNVYNDGWDEFAEVLKTTTSQYGIPIRQNGNRK